MKAFALLAGLSAVHLGLFSQTLYGIVTLQNSGNKPLAGVQIISAGANPAISQADGRFTLVYAGRREGDNVFLQAARQGYEVVNHKDLSTRLRANASDSITIYMCPQGELEARRLKYYQIQDSYITKRYQQELQALRRQKKDGKETLKALDDQRQNAIAYAKELAERLSVTNLDACSHRYRQAFAAFERGEVAQAITMLNESENDLLRAQKELRNVEHLTGIASAKYLAAKKNRKEAIDCYMLKGDLLGLNFKFEEALSYYEKGANADTTDLDNNLKAANYLSSQHQYSRAIIYFERVALVAVKEAGKERYQAEAICNIGEINYINNAIFTAQKNLFEALALYKKLQTQNPVYQEKIANIYSDLGDVYKSLKQYDKAKENYAESLKIIQDNLDVYPVRAAITLFQIGHLNILKGELKTADSILSVVLEMEREMIDNHQTDNDRIAPLIVNTITSLIDLCIAQKNFAWAERHLTAALELCDTLVKSNPQRYTENKATALMSAGRYYYNVGKLELAKKAFQEAVNLRAILAKDNPFAHERYMAFCLLSLGSITLLLQDTVNALKTIGQGLDLYRKMSPEDHTATKPLIANSLTFLSSVHLIQRNLPQAQAEIEEAISIYEELKKSPTFDLTQLVQTYLSAASIYMITRPRDSIKIKKGREFLRKAQETLSICEKTEYAKALGILLKQLQAAYLTL